jgi:hypothetical protein
MFLISKGRTTILNDQFDADHEYIIDAFALYTKLIFSTSTPSVTPDTAVFYCSIYVSGVIWTEKRLKPLKCTGMDEITSFVIKGCFDRFTPLLTCIFNLSATSVTLWEGTSVAPVFKRDNNVIVSYYRPIINLYLFHKIF